MKDLNNKQLIIRINIKKFYKKSSDKLISIRNPANLKIIVIKKDYEVKKYKINLVLEIE